MRPPPPFLRVEAPGPAFARNLPPLPGSEGHLHAHRQRLADGPGLEDLFCPDQRRVILEVLEGAEDPLGPVRRGDQLVAFGHGHRHRFLHGDVLARGEGVGPHARVQVVGGDDVDGVDLGVVEEISVVGVRFRCPPLRCAFAGAVPVCVTDGEELGVGGAGVPAGVEPGDVAGPDDADADLAHSGVRGTGCPRSIRCFPPTARPRGRGCAAWAASP